MNEEELFALMKEIDPETKRVPMGIMRLVVKLEERIRSQIAASISTPAHESAFQDLIEHGMGAFRTSPDGSVEHISHSDILELLPALATQPEQGERKPVAWIHTMDNTDGIEGNEPKRRLSFSAANPFGVPGKDYDELYPVTSKPLYEGE